MPGSSSSPSARGVTLTLSQELSPALRPLVSAVRGAFDLEADMVAIDAALEGDAALDVAAAPGLRITGGLDPFETAVRAVLGQQVTLEAGRKLAQKLVDAFGADLATGMAGLNRVFPDAARLAAVDPGAIAALGMPRARAETVQRLAQAVAEGRVTLARGAIAAGRAGLECVAGIGPWTVEYVALRGLGDPDAFPAGDSALRGALGLARGVEDRAEAWRPWRAYAATRLWRKHALSQRKPASARIGDSP